MATSHILSAIEPSLSNNINNIGGLGTTLHQNNNNNNINNNSLDIDRNCNIALDDRDLWMRFQNLTNEMIVTKNGR